MLVAMLEYIRGISAPGPFFFVFFEDRPGLWTLGSDSQVLSQIVSNLGFWQSE